MNEWWNQENSEPVDCHVYKIGDSTIYIGKRLDRKGCSKSFFDSIDLFISLNDDYIPYPVGKSNYWIPWREGTDIFPQYVVYSGLSILRSHIFELSTKNIYIHCDLGTHRAPSLFGAFLVNYVDDYEKVINNASSTVLKSRYFSEKRLIFNPIEYYNDKINQVPLIKFFIKYLKNNPSLGLDKISSLYHEILPFELLSPAQKKERQIELKICGFYKNAKKMLLKNGFIFEDNAYSEFKCTDTNNEISFLWLCALPLEPYHGLFESNISKGNIYIVSPRNAKKYSNKKLCDYKNEYIDINYDNYEYQILKIYKKE
jgi:hypothetical protein